MSNNTHPNTPLGKWFDKHGLWRAHWEDAIVDAYNKMHIEERGAITTASGFIAIVNNDLQASPDSIFELTQKHYPDITKNYLTGKLNDLNRMLLKINANVPDTFEDAVKKLQAYLSQYTGKAWAVITRATVEVLADIFLRGETPLEKIELVLEYIYRTFIKDKI